MYDLNTPESDFSSNHLTKFFTHVWSKDEMLEEVRVLYNEHPENRQELLDFCYWLVDDISTQSLVLIFGASDFKVLWKMVTTPFRPIGSECANCFTPIDALVYNRTQLNEFNKTHASMLEACQHDKVINYSLDDAKKHFCANCYDELIKNPNEFGQVVYQEYPTDSKPLFDSTFYKKYLASNDWQIVRRLALDNADNRCQLCYSRFMLQVHHRTYERLGHEKLSDLTVLCADCHAKFHGKEGGQ